MFIPICGELSIKYEIIVPISEFKGNDDRYELNAIKELWIKYADEYCKNRNLKYSIPTLVYDAKELYNDNNKCGIDGKPVVVFHCTYINNSIYIPTYEEFENGIIYIVKNLKRELNLSQIKMTKIDAHTCVI